MSTRFRFFLIVAFLMVSPGIGLPTAAQQATPVITCDVTPRTAAELSLLAATPTTIATSQSATPEPVPTGEPADADTVKELDRTLQMADACARENDVWRLLALYSDRFIVTRILANSSEPIVPGTPSATPTVPFNESAMIPSQPIIETAQMLSDGRAVALVRTGTQRQIMLFVYSKQQNFWRIDEIEQLVELGRFAITNLPAEAHLALQHAAQYLDVDETTLSVVWIEATQWSDSSLGCPEPDTFYAQVVTPGYVIVIRGDHQELEYHTDQQRHVVLCHE